MKICEYGCGQEAKYQFKNGKWCCSKRWSSCPINRKNHSNQMKKLRKDPNSKYNSSLYKEKISNIMKKIWKNPNGVFKSISYKNKFKLTINQINKRYPFFSKIEEMRYNPNKSNEKEIQVHCKNHNCENSKEKDGWFIPTKIQISERIRQLESEEGNGGSYFYCSQYCKDTCPLYQLQSDPLKNNNLPYTLNERSILNKFVLKRDNYVCQFCGKPATDVHHERPQKLEPFFALDPDYAWACCEKCHYEKGHQDECSTGNLAKIVCSVESQKFLNQKII